MILSLINRYLPKQSNSLYLRSRIETNFKTDITVIFQPKSKPFATIEQLKCIIKIIKENYPESTFQIISFINFSENVEDVSKLIRSVKNDNRIQWEQTRSNYFENFVIGCARATGKVIVDAQYLSNEIYGLLNREPMFIHFAERNVESIFGTMNKNKYLLPVSISKFAANKLFCSVPNVPYGYAKSLYQTAERENIAVVIFRSKNEPLVDDPVEIIITEVVTKFLEKYK
jgi:hypothetical protein